MAGQGQAAATDQPLGAAWVIPDALRKEYERIVTTSRKNNQLMEFATETPHSLIEGTGLDIDPAGAFVKIREHDTGSEVVAPITQRSYMKLKNVKLKAT